jgi:hypothetical protein
MYDISNISFPFEAKSKSDNVKCKELEFTKIKMNEQKEKIILYFWRLIQIKSQR